MEKQCKLIHDAVDSAWKKLDEIWHKIGHDANSIQKRKTAVFKHTNQLLEEMLEEEGEKLTEQQTKLEKLYQEILQLLKDLTMDHSVATEAKANSQGKTLLEKEIIFEKIADDLRKRKAVRMEKYNKVNVQVVDLSTELDEEPFTIKFEGIPSDAQVGQLEQKLQHLQKEKIRRQNLLKKLKKNISVLFQCLERIPRNELERLISLDEPPTGIKTLSLKTLHEMEELESNMNQEVCANRNEGELLWQKIKELWSRLKVDENEEGQISFKKVHQSIQYQLGGDNKQEIIYKPTVLRGLQSELNRLEEEKKLNMALFIGQVRDELTALWKTKCFMNDTAYRFDSDNYANLTEFSQFDFVSEIYTEELLDKHEREVDYWRNFVERNKKIIDGVIKREQMFAQYRELDQKSDDPARLSNRGGALLREEKERKMLEKSIPKLENELKQLSQKFAAEKDAGHGMQMFQVYSKDIPELIDMDWTAFHDEKEKRKEMRKKETAGGGGGNKTMMTTQLGSRPPKRAGTPSGMLAPMTPKRSKLPPASTPTPGKPFASPFASTKKPGMKPPNVMDNDNFTRPATRSRFGIPGTNTVSSKKPTGMSKIPGSRATKEQVNPAVPLPVPSVVVSPAASYSEFTGPLLCQSTLNSSAVSSVVKNRKPLSSMPADTPPPPLPKDVAVDDEMDW